MENKILNKYRLIIENILKEHQSDIKFFKKSHEYISRSEPDIKFTSITSFVSIGKPPFNPKEISLKVSQTLNSEYYGIEPKIIMSLWSKNTARGTKKHKQVEDYLNKKLKNSCAEELRNFNITPENCLSEIKVMSKEFRLSGTIDIVEICPIDENNCDIFISDIKTYKQLDDERIKSFQEQIYIYCLIFKDIIKKYKEKHSEIDINFNVKFGRLVWYKPKNSIINENYEKTDLCCSFEDVKVLKYIPKKYFCDDINQKLKKWTNDFKK